MMTIHFYKYQGTGNDFVILDNRKGDYDSLSREQVAYICHRRFGIGADGLMLLNTLPGYHFEMKYFNADGAESSMCGNGGRCLVQFAKACGIAAETYRFMAIDGEHTAEVIANSEVALKMNDVANLAREADFCVLNTGSPHYVTAVENLSALNVAAEGKAIRYSAPYASEGINVNFSEGISENSIFVRTYERGVEDETFSCGTGVTAAALVQPGNRDGLNQVRVKTLGGNLRVNFNKEGDHYTDIWLIGPAEQVFEGTLNLPF